MVSYTSFNNTFSEDTINSGTANTITYSTTATTMTICTDYYESSTTVTGSYEFKEEIVNNIKEYPTYVNKVRLKSIKANNINILYNRKTTRSLIYPLANKGWKGKR